MIGIGEWDDSFHKDLSEKVVVSKQYERCTVVRKQGAFKNDGTKQEIMKTVDVIFIDSGASAAAACRAAQKLLK